MRALPDGRGAAAVIITDGLMIPYNIVFGRGAAADFKDAYMDAKKNGKIRFSL